MWGNLVVWKCRLEERCGAGRNGGNVIHDVRPRLKNQEDTFLSWHFGVHLHHIGLFKGHVLPPFAYRVKATSPKRILVLSLGLKSIIEIGCGLGGGDGMAFQSTSSPAVAWRM